MNDGDRTETPPHTWPGSYYDGKTSAQQPVTVTLTPRGMTIQLESGGTLFWAYEEIQQTQGEHAGEPARFECGSPLPEAVVINDPSFLQDLRRVVQSRFRQFRFPTPLHQRLGMLGGALVVSVAAVGAMVLWGIPALADLTTPFVPVSWEVALGKSALEQMVPDEQRCTNGALKKQTDLLLARLVDPSKSPYELHLTIVDFNQFNAYALPGGEIVVFRPLLQATKNPEELAGVLAHEAQHVLLRHTTKSLLRDLSLAALVGALFGDVTGIGALTVQAARTLSTLQYSRGMEEEADLEGLRLLQQAHFNPSGMVYFFETLQQREGHLNVPPYLSTHPQTEERIARLRALLHQSPDAAPATPDEDWKQITALCRE